MISLILGILSILLYTVSTIKDHSNKVEKIVFELGFAISLMFVIFYSKPANVNFCWYDIIAVLFFVALEIFFLPVEQADESSDHQKNQWISYESVYRTVFLAVVFYYLMIRGLDVGFEGEFNMHNWLTTIGITIAVCVVDTIIGIRIKFFKLIGWKTNVLQSFFITVFMYFFVALPEEFLYRGLLYKYLTAFFPTMPNLFLLFVSSILFGLAHWRMGKMMLLATVAGFGYGLTYVYTNNLYLAIVTHLAVNVYWQSCFLPVKEKW